MFKDEEISVLLSAQLVPVVESKVLYEEELPLTMAELLCKVFQILDIKLNLYFTNHSSAADLDLMLKEVSKSVHKKLSISIVLQILYLYPESFKVTETTNGHYLIDLPNLKLNSMKLRREQFEELVEKWIEENGEEEVPCSTIDETITDTFNNKIKLMKNANKRLKNDSKDFNFKEKKETTTKLSILERIKLKEKQRAVKVDLEVPIESKLEPIYNILYNLQTTKKRNNYTLLHLTQVIRDSYKTTIHEDDILHNLTRLSELVDGIKIEELKNLKIIKFDNLNRDKDLNAIRLIQSI